MSTPDKPDVTSTVTGAKAAVPQTPRQAGTGLKGQHRREHWLFASVCALATWSSVVILILLIGSLLYVSWGWLDWGFLTSYHSRRPEDAGFFAGIVGSAWMIFFTILFAVPLGIGAALYLEEYASNNWLTRTIRINIANLAGVPSIVYGILGLTVFVRMFGLFAEGGPVEQWTGQHIEGIWYSESLERYLILLPFGRTVISGSLTMTLLILPVIIVAAQEALRAVPPSLRHASLALGATKWQTVRHQILPSATPGIMTGVILAVSRAIGETAPIVMIGAMTVVYFTPGGISSFGEIFTEPSKVVAAPFDTFTVMPIQIFYWVRETKEEFRYVAAAGIVVLLAILLTLNGLAIYIRNHYQKRMQW